MSELSELRNKMIQQDLIEVTSTDAGKRVIAKIIEMSRPRADPFVQGAADTTAYMIGMQRVGIAVVEALREIDPRLVAECDAALIEFEKQFSEEEDSE